MARQSLFWGKAKGKLGEVVLYRAGGEQRSRTYVKNIKNPKTLAQMEQRIKMASLVGFFNQAKIFLRNSFTNRPVQQTGFNAFMAKSLPSAYTVISKSSADAGYSVPADYAISSGSVALGNKSNDVITLTNLESSNVIRGIRMSNVLIEQIKETAVSDGSDFSSILSGLFSEDEVWKALPNVFNINVICSVYDDEGFTTLTRQFKIDKSGSTPTIEGDFSQFKYNVYPFGVTGYTAENATNSYLVIGYGVGDSAGNGAYMCGYFVSYNDADGKLVTSNATMKVVSDPGNRVLQYAKGGEVYNDYLAELGVGDTDILATR